MRIGGDSERGVIGGHSRPKDGVALLAYDPAIHRFVERGWIAGSRRLRGGPAMTMER